MMKLIEQAEGYLLESDVESNDLNNGGVAWGDLMPPRLGGQAPHVSIEALTDGWQRVRLTWQLDAPVQQDELALALRLRVQPDFWWAPHLAPDVGDCMAQHVFRSPALIASMPQSGVPQASNAITHLVLVPDLDICGKALANPWFLDLDAPARTFWLGMARTEIPEHVRYRKKGGMEFAAGRVELGFFITLDHETGIDADKPANPFGKVSRFLWARYGKPLFEQDQPIAQPLDPYVKHVYTWAFDTWKEAVWQEFELEGKRVGAPAFIVMNLH